MNASHQQFAAIAAVLILAFTLSTPAKGQYMSNNNQQHQEETPIAPGSIDNSGSMNTPNGSDPQSPELQASPVIRIWHNQPLRFGHIGNPQEQINILGHVLDTDGNLSSLSYRLNGGAPVNIPIGTGNIRLVNPGDFNIAIDTSSLINGSNEVVITARDSSGAEDNETVNFTYTRGRTWPLPYSTNWSGTASINDQAQVVDGRWELVPGGVRTAEVGYDRLIAIGDENWTHSYEVLVPITVHSFHPDPANPSDSGGVGIIIRWQGHQGPGPLPTDWTHLGAYAYYSNRRNGLTLRLDGSRLIVREFSFDLNRTYFFKVRVQSETSSGPGIYSFKVWAQNQPEPDWNHAAFDGLVNVADSNNDLHRGSILLVAHRANATFGDVSINFIPPEPGVLENKVYLPTVKR